MASRVLLLDAVHLRHTLPPLRLPKRELQPRFPAERTLVPPRFAVPSVELATGTGSSLSFLVNRYPLTFGGVASAWICGVNEVFYSYTKPRPADAALPQAVTVEP